MLSMHKAPLQNNILLLTGWLIDVLPAHEGVYARQAPAGPYSCFTGDRWFGDAATPAAAAASRLESPRQRAAWRGLVARPDEVCGTCRGHSLIDHGVDAESGRDLIQECPDC